MVSVDLVEDCKDRGILVCPQNSFLTSYDKFDALAYTSYRHVHERVYGRVCENVHGDVLQRVYGDGLQRWRYPSCAINDVIKNDKF